MDFGQFLKELNSEISATQAPARTLPKIISAAQ